MRLLHPHHRSLFGLPIIFFIGAFFSPGIVFAQSAPYTQTQFATNITEKSAQLNGQVNPNLTTDTLSWFEWGIASRPETIYVTQQWQVYQGNTLYPTSVSLQGLAPKTQYYFRQIAENNRGKYTGGTYYFTTKDIPTQTEPIVLAETRDATNVSQNNATLVGYVSPHGNQNAKFWFEWGTSDQLGSRTAERGQSYSSALVTENISGLAPGTLYYFRAVGGGGGGEYRGLTKTFQTTGTKGAVPVTPAPGTTGSPSASSASSADIASLELLVEKLQAEVVILLQKIVAELAKRGIR